MPNSSHFTNSAQLSEEQKQKALQLLVDMFNCPPDRQLRSICESLSWNVERCIDFLINANDQDHIQTQKNSGAIPKQTLIMGDRDALRTSFKQRQNLNGYSHLAQSNSNQDSSMANVPVEQRIGELISTGAKVMVIMRGAPGSGKTTLAMNLLEQYVTLNKQYTIEDFIFSSDDFFYKSSGRYKWHGGLLEQAHQFNQLRVKQRAQKGWSPIFVDNTNVKLWEMIYYARVAVQNGYVIELLEPKTSWGKSACKLAQKTKHGVPSEKIQVMLNNFEKGTVDDLLKMLSTTKYNVTLPQMRSIPPIQLKQQDAETKEVFQVYKPDNNFENIYNDTEVIASENISPANKENVPKPQRDRSASKVKSTPSIVDLKPASLMKTADEHQAVENNESNVWQPHEKEINKFWNIENINNASTKLRENESRGKSIIDLLRVPGAPEGSSSKINNDGNDTSMKSGRNFERHSINCPNESKAFTSLRQIYPNKELTSLWDLFVKCDGDIDWTVDLLLREEELMVTPNRQYFESVPEVVDDFRCSCSTKQNEADVFNYTEIPPTPAVTSLGIGIKPQRQRSRTMRTNQRSNPELREITDVIANRFVLDGDQFSPHVRKLREMREKLRDPPERCFTNTEVQTDPVNEVEHIEDNTDGEVNEIIEVNLGDDLVKQLKNIFQDEMISLVERLPSNPAVNIFMPRSLAKELYMLWVESAYNHLEEQRQKTTREDADFARLLKIPKYENYTQSPGNIEELLDMELAWKIYKNDHESEIQKAINTQQFYQPNDLADHLTQLKLCENFPNIPRETLIEILSAHANNYDETVRVLKIMAQPVEDLQEDSTLQENKMIEKEQLPHNTKIKVSEDRTPRAPLQPDEAKRKALHDFEEMRNLAAHHCQLKAECYQKAKEAIQKGSSAVAVYYSQVANLHKMKLDMYNHRAANCIMDVHKYTQNNPDLLDLHYLHVMEAIGCLDIFLDRHITGLRAASRTYKHIFIITGRGLHSTGGVSTIKNKVKTRLKERNIRWSEVNPGLLKVKIFSASKHSKNI